MTNTNTTTTPNTSNTYALATGLKGFGPHTTLRVRVLETRDGVAFVVTADLLDVGTRLALNPGQLQPESEAPAGVRHSSGLVVLGC